MHQGALMFCSIRRTQEKTSRLFRVKAYMDLPDSQACGSCLAFCESIQCWLYVSSGYLKAWSLWDHHRAHLPDSDSLDMLLFSEWWLQGLCLGLKLQSSVSTKGGPIKQLEQRKWTEHHIGTHCTPYYLTHRAPSCSKHLMGRKMMSFITTKERAHQFKRYHSPVSDRQFPAMCGTVKSAET